MVGFVLYYHYSGSFLLAGLGLMKMVVKEMCEDSMTTHKEYSGLSLWSLYLVSCRGLILISEYGIGLVFLKIESEKEKGENGITEIALRHPECLLRNTVLFLLLFFLIE